MPRNLIKFKQLDTGEFGSFVENIVTGADFLSGKFYPLNSNPSGYITSGQTGAILDSTVVRTFGNQFIAGQKRFVSLYSDRITATGDPGFGAFAAYIDIVNGRLVTQGTQILGEPGSYSLDWNNKRLYDGISPNTNPSNISLHWGNRQLSGNWLTNTVPTLNQHIVNFGFLKTGNFTINNVVYTTGAQTINGNKSFNGFSTFVGGASFGFLPTTNYEVGIDPNNPRLQVYDGDSFWGVDLRNMNLVGDGSSFSNVTLDWSNLYLTGGVWTMNYSPTLSGHLVNKGYVDRLVTGGNIPNVVYITGSQIIVGQKSFTSQISGVSIVLGNTTNYGTQRFNGGNTATVYGIEWYNQNTSSLVGQLGVFGSDGFTYFDIAGGKLHYRNGYNGSTFGIISPSENTYIGGPSSFTNTGGAVAQYWYSNSVINSAAITEHYGRTGIGVGSYARMGGTYGTAGTSYGLFSDSSVNLLANGGNANIQASNDVNLYAANGFNTWVRGNVQLRFENYVGDKINLYSTTYGFGVAPDELRNYVEVPGSRFSFGYGPYSSFVEGARIYGSGSAEFKKVTTSSGFLVNVNTSGLLPDPVFGSKNVSGLYYDFQVDQNGNLIVNSFATSQSSIQSYDINYQSNSGAVLTLPDDANQIFWNSNGATGNITITGVSGAALGPTYFLVNNDPTRAIIFTNNSAVKVRGTGFALGYMDSCTIIPVSSTGISVH